MKKLIVAWQFFLVSILFADAKKTDLHFVCYTDLKEFVNRYIPDDKQEDFLVYYQELDKKMKQADEVQRRKIFTHLHKTALDVLEKDRPDWHQSIITVFGNPLMTIHTDENWQMAQKATDVFLTRYGAFHTFARTTIKENTPEGFWESLLHSFTGWFGWPKQKII